MQHPLVKQRSPERTNGARTGAKTDSASGTWNSHSCSPTLLSPASSAPRRSACPSPRSPRPSSALGDRFTTRLGWVHPHPRPTTIPLARSTRPSRPAVRRPHPRGPRGTRAPRPAPGRRRCHRCRRACSHLSCCHRGAARRIAWGRWCTRAITRGRCRQEADRSCRAWRRLCGEDFTPYVGTRNSSREGWEEGTRLGRAGWEEGTRLGARLGRAGWEEGIKADWELVRQGETS